MAKRQSEAKRQTETKGEYLSRIKGVQEHRRKWNQLCLVIECDRMAECREICTACYSRVAHRFYYRGISMKTVTDYKLHMEASISHRDYLQLEPRTGKELMGWEELQSQPSTESKTSTTPSTSISSKRGTTNAADTPAKGRRGAATAMKAKSDVGTRHRTRHRKNLKRQAIAAAP